MRTWIKWMMCKHRVVYGHTVVLGTPVMRVHTYAYCRDCGKQVEFQPYTSSAIETLLEHAKTLPPGMAEVDGKRFVF